MPDPFQSSGGGGVPFVGRDYNPDHDREWIRGALTVAAMLIFVAVIAAYLVAAIRISDAGQWMRIKEATEVILPTVTSVLGSALGFYFGSQKK